jgi:hypothetical protein
MIHAVERRPIGRHSLIVYGSTTRRSFIYSLSTSEMPDCYHFHSSHRIIARRHGARCRRFSKCPILGGGTTKLDGYRYDIPDMTSRPTRLRFDRKWALGAPTSSIPASELSTMLITRELEFAEVCLVCCGIQSENLLTSPYALD